MKYIRFAIIAVLVIIADQFTKYLVLAQIAPV